MLTTFKLREGVQKYVKNIGFNLHQNRNSLFETAFLRTPGPIIYTYTALGKARVSAITLTTAPGVAHLDPAILNDSVNIGIGISVFAEVDKVFYSFWRHAAKQLQN